MDASIKSSIRRKPNGFLMVQVKGKFTTPRPLYANAAGLLLKIGSDASNHIQIKNAEVAPFHAELRQVTFQGQSKVIIQDCRPATNFLPILVGTQEVPSQSTMMIPQDMPNICIGSHKFVFLYTIPPMLLAMYPQLAQQEWMQHYNTTPASTNALTLSQSQRTDMLSQSRELPHSNLNVVKKEEPATKSPTQQISQEKTLTASSSSSINSESEPETQPNLLDQPSQRSDSEEVFPENSAKDNPHPYSLQFLQKEANVDEDTLLSKPQSKSKKSSKRTEEHESTAESTVEGIKSSDKEHLTSASESEPASKPSNKKKATPKSAKKKQTKKNKEYLSERSEEEPSTAELANLAKEYLDNAEEFLSESSSSERPSYKPSKSPKKTPKRTPKLLKKPAKTHQPKSAKKVQTPVRNDWTCGTCGINKKMAMVDCQGCGAWHHSKCCGYNEPTYFVCDPCKAQFQPIAEEDDAECPVCRHVCSENPFLEMLQCDGCDDWFHLRCVGVRPGKKQDWICEQCTKEGREKIERSEEEEMEQVKKSVRVVVKDEEEEDHYSEIERVTVVLGAKGSQSAKKATKTKKMTRKVPNTVAASKTRKVTTPKKTPSKKAAPVPPSDSEGQEPSSSDESDSDEKENVFDTYKLRQKEGQFVPKISSKFAYFKSPPMDLAKTRLQQKTSPAPKKLF